MLDVLGDRMNEALAEKQKCQDEADATALTIDLANRLVNGLASEKIRWTETVETLATIIHFPYNSYKLNYWRHLLPMLQGDILEV